MSESQQLRIRKRPLEVDLALEGSEPRRVTLFLADQQANDFTRQRVLDLLEQSASFLPAGDTGSGSWETFNTRSVVWIGMALSATDEGSGDELFEHRQPVRVDLAGGSSLEGELLYSAPDGNARVVDHLNREERFFRLWKGDRVYLVNKARVLRVVERPEE